VQPNHFLFRFISISFVYVGVGANVSFPIFKFLLKRVGLGVLTLLAISLMIFFVTQALPSDPARMVMGKDATADSVKAFNVENGLDKPLLSQYQHWLGGVLRGDFGKGYTTRAPIWDYIAPRVGASLFLLVVAGIVSVPLSILLGTYGGLKRDGRFDNSSSVVMLLLAALPEFVVGTLLVILLSTFVFKILPATTYIPPDAKPWVDPKGLILPVITLSLGVIPYVSRTMRASIIEVLESDYIEMARLKGMPERTVVWRHALPNAIGPVFQVIALNLAYLAGGVIIVERLFNFPGIGQALAESVRSRDLPIVQFLALAIAMVYVLTNLLADIGTVLVTPRLRTRLT
jgi:peptide/nickel transport system permease protein